MEKSKATKSDTRLDASMTMRQNIARLQDTHNELVSSLDCILNDNNIIEGANVVDDKERKRALNNIRSTMLPFIKKAAFEEMI